jgi:hypothetical protein
MEKFTLRQLAQVLPGCEQEFFSVFRCFEDVIHRAGKLEDQTIVNINENLIHDCLSVV